MSIPWQLLIFLLFCCLSHDIEVVADIFYTRSGFRIESNCTGRDRDAALNCIHDCDIGRFDFSSSPDILCKHNKRCVDCFSETKNTKCFTSDILAQDRDIIENDITWTDLLKTINMCGNGSKEDLSKIGCLYYKSLFYIQRCGMMELDDCEKRLESVRCRMEYIQSVCNTATAMKICENYIIEGGHCVDAVSQCRNMTFINDSGPLTRGYQEYIDSYEAIQTSDLE